MPVDEHEQALDASHATPRAHSTRLPKAHRTPAPIPSSRPTARTCPGRCDPPSAETSTPSKSFDDLNPRLLRYLRTLVHTEAEYVAAETWLHSGRYLTAFHGTWHKWRSRSIPIARKRALDHIRHQQRRPHAHITIEELQERSNHHNTETDALSRLAWQTALLLITTLPKSEAEPSCYAASWASPPPKPDTSSAKNPAPSAPPLTADSANSPTTPTS
ncbi:hypothetical protein OG979_34865 [Actinomadura citrea]|uniref:RNA polymerase sigma factor n=1 Tax=Actinomadura citrea TaxID=46158 RepID=UPI002E2E83E3|nr:hypothetical protein [Actinomadura citrea]